MPPIFPTSTFAHGNAGGFGHTQSGTLTSASASTNKRTIFSPGN